MSEAHHLWLHGQDEASPHTNIDRANAERLAETKALRELTGLDADKESGK